MLLFSHCVVSSCCCSYILHTNTSLIAIQLLELQFELQIAKFQQFKLQIAKFQQLIAVNWTTSLICLQFTADYRLQFRWMMNAVSSRMMMMICVLKYCRMLSVSSLLCLATRRVYERSTIKVLLSTVRINERFGTAIAIWVFSIGSYSSTTGFIVICHS